MAQIATQLGPPPLVHAFNPAAGVFWRLHQQAIPLAEPGS
jgi:hypothetical protein